jgi:transglutaminase-like putative cysteine protease
MLMSLERWFSLSFYLTLGLSCVALVFTELFFLPGLQVCLAPVLALLLLAWWVEGRWSLPAWGANALGLLIAAGVAVWLTMHLSDSESWLSRVPLQLAVLPYTGPLLIAALLVRVFRPRGPGDFWRLQGLGLMQVGLGCILAGGPEFGILLIAYLASGLACLTLHYRQSAVGSRLSACQPSIADSRRPIAVRWLLPFTLRWTLLVSGLALLLFLLTPRRDGSSWEPLHLFRAERESASTLQVGLGEEINLNRTGTLEPDNEVALQVAFTDSADQPRRDLPAEQRWRGGVLDWYESGKWRAAHQAPLLPNSPHGPRRQRQLPDFGPGQSFLTFTIQPRQAGGLVLAEPLRLGPPPNRLPVVPVADAVGRPALFVEMSGTVLPLLFTARQEYRYRQVIPAGADPERTPAESLREGAYLERLTRQNVHGLRDWTLELLHRLSSQPRYSLPEGVRAVLAQPRRKLLLTSQQWEPVARALTDYLANSGEFTYSLEMTRHDRSVDPVMDFLVHLKQGHCERYATALALMLRALGIPARVVKGYRGADDQGDGIYVVRHSHAHAWVEMLVPHGEPHHPAFDWLTLDPTPAGSAATRTSFSLSHWWQEGQRNVQQWWQELIVDYNADQQADLWDNLRPGRHLSGLRKFGGLLLAGLTGLLALVLLRRLVRRRRAAAGCAAGVEAFYGRLLALLAQHAALRPRFGQTPREFGERARQLLQTRPRWSVLADLPSCVIEQFYRVRFGGQPLSAPESQAMVAELERMAEVLRS